MQVEMREPAQALTCSETRRPCQAQAPLFDDKTGPDEYAGADGKQQANGLVCHHATEDVCVPACLPALEIGTVTGL